MKNNKSLYTTLIILLLLSPQYAFSGFFDDLKKSFSVSTPNARICKTRADYFSKPQIGTLTAKSNIYRGPNSLCGVGARTTNGGNVNVLGEYTDWFYIGIKGSQGKLIKGWVTKDRISLLSNIQTPPKQQITQVDTSNEKTKIRNNRSQQTYPKEMVAEVQQLLNEQGYNAGPTDGIFGQGTRSALLSFQSDMGLAKTGKLDLDTLTTLKNAGGSKISENAEDAPSITSSVGNQPNTNSKENSQYQLVKNTSLDKSEKTTITNQDDISQVANTNIGDVTLSSSHEGNIEKRTSIQTKEKIGSSPQVETKDIKSYTVPDGITFKNYACDISNNIVHVFFDKTVDAGNDKVVKELLLNGAVYGESACKKMSDTWMRNQGIEVSLYPNTDLYPDYKKYIAKASFYPDKNFEMTKFHYRGGDPLKSEMIMRTATAKEDYSKKVVKKKDNAEQLFMEGSTTFKITRCYRRSSMTHVYIDDSIKYWNDLIANNLLIKGAKYAQENCLNYDKEHAKTHGYPIAIFRKSDLSQKRSKSVVTGKVFPSENFKIKQYINLESFKRKEKIRKTIVTKGDISIENVYCNNSGYYSNVTNVYVNDNKDITDDKHAKELLQHGIVHGKSVCGANKKKVIAKIFPKSLQTRYKDKEPWAYLAYDQDKYHEYHNK